MKMRLFIGSAIAAMALVSHVSSPLPVHAEDSVAVSGARNGSGYLISVAMHKAYPGTPGGPGGTGGSPPSNDPDAPPTPPPDDPTKPPPPTIKIVDQLGCAYYQYPSGRSFKLCRVPVPAENGNLTYYLEWNGGAGNCGSILCDVMPFTHTIEIPERFDFPSIGFEWADLIASKPVDLGVEVQKTVPLPVVTLHANPEIGMVHVPAWWWVRGYDGRTFGRTANVYLLPEKTIVSVRVLITGRSYRWDFGDGAPAQPGALGRRYPAESDVRHVYAYSSIDQPKGFETTLSASFGGTYSVNGGPGGRLPELQQRYEGRHKVQEAQSVLVGR